MSALTLKTEGDRHVVVTRRFAASPEAVFRAHVEPKLIQRWIPPWAPGGAAVIDFVNTSQSFLTSTHFRIG